MVYIRKARKAAVSGRIMDVHGKANPNLAVKAGVSAGGAHYFSGCPPKADGPAGLFGGPGLVWKISGGTQGLTRGL